MANVHRPRVFVDVNIGEQPAGRLTIELFTDKTPKTCENFRQLCTGEHNSLLYMKAPFHRVINEFMIQGGDIANGDGTGMVSIYGGEFEDENLHWREMDAAGLVCSANRGKDTNGSQFFLTLEPCPHLDGKHTIFGKLVSGQDILDKIAKVKVDKNDRPLEPVLVARCGELERRQKKLAPQPERATNERSTDRGRRRKSDASDEEMTDTPTPPGPRTSRRKSDNVVDEGLRGRPRQRSGSRSVSKALSTTEEEGASDEMHSPAKKHKRKRGQSPSRHLDDDRMQDDDTKYERRRRSLPNQYGDERYNRNYGDEDRYRPSPRHDNREYAGRRADDRYRPPQGRHRYEDDAGRLNSGGGRLGGGGYDEHEPPVKFKGRGVMKYRELGSL